MTYSTKKDKEILYRGEPQPKYAKRRRQIWNLKAEKRENILTIFIIFFLIAPVFGCILFNPNTTSLNKLVRSIIAAIANGVSTLNKFRKHYDIDTSEESEGSKKTDR